MFSQYLFNKERVDVSYFKLLFIHGCVLHFQGFIFCHLCKKTVENQVQRCALSDLLE